MISEDALAFSYMSRVQRAPPLNFLATPARDTVQLRYKLPALGANKSPTDHLHLHILGFNL